MKLSDVVAQLQLILPKFSTLLSTSLPITSIVAASNVATVVTSSAHSLTAGDQVVLANVEVKTPITGVSKDGLLYTFTTSPAHDLTLTWPPHATITLSGFTDGAWNDTFTLKSSPNRNDFVIQSTNSLPSLNGNEVLHEVRTDGVNGRFAPTIVNTTTFTIAGSFLDGNYTGGSVNSEVRIAGAVTIERAIEQYTKQGLTDLWIFVTMHDAEVSKDRHSYSDATATRTVGDDIRTRLIDGFTITALKNATQDIAAVDAIDILRHDLLQPILKSVNGARFDTGLDGDADFKSILTAHGLALYEKAYVGYNYDFEFVVEITAGDSVNIGDTRAFRDIDYTLRQGGGDTEDMTITLDLDDDAELS